MVIEVVVVVFIMVSPMTAFVSEKTSSVISSMTLYGLRLGDPADAYLVHDGLYDVHGVVMDFHEFRFVTGTVLSVMCVTPFAESSFAVPLPAGVLSCESIPKSEKTSFSSMPFSNIIASTFFLSD